MKPELLSPAGTLKNMRYAFAYGADAVYAGQPRYSLRARNNDFMLPNLEVGIGEAHQQGKKFYVVSNIAPHNSKLKTYLKDMAPVVALKPDALIMSDPGLIMMVRDTWPDMPVHLSVQANAVNFATVKFWQRYGVERVILSRELSLDEVEEIRQQCSDIELEIFVHGALCIAYSGRCLLSGYMNHRDANQGVCTNACRWNYQAHAAEEDIMGDLVASVPAADASGETCGAGMDDTRHEGPLFLLQEKTRTGEYMPAFEDEHGTYIMNSRDLRAVQHVRRLVEMGIDSLKIEGRTKSHYYAARTAQVYRQAIDDAVAGRDFDMSLMDSLESLANRGYTEGFLRRHVHDEFQNYLHGSSVSERQLFVGEITGMDVGRGTLEVAVKNRFEVGDSLELMTPRGCISFELTAMTSANGEQQNVAPGSGHIVHVSLPDAVILNDDMRYALVLKNLGKPVAAA